MAVQPGQRKPLSARDSELAHPAIERGAQQPCDVGNDDPDVIIGIGHDGNCSGS
jgi:hypothetical protein